MTYRDIIGIPDALKANINSLAIDDPDAADLAMHAASTAAHNLGATWEEKYLARGLSRSGLTVGQAGWFFEEFTDIARWNQTMGLTPFTALVTVSGGVVEGAPGIGDTQTYVNGSAAFLAPSLMAGNAMMYVAGRIRLSVGVPADGIAVFGLNLGFGGILAGALLAIEPVHFCMIVMGGGGMFLTSTVALDNNWHDIEFWGDGSNGYYFSVDSETPVLGVLGGGPYLDMLHPMIQVTSGAVVPVAMDLDKLLYVFPQAT